MTDVWLPLDADKPDAPYSVLHKKVTPWLRPSLTEWIAKRIGFDGYTHADVLRQLERVLRVQLTAHHLAEVAAMNILTYFENTGREWVLVDYLLATTATAADVQKLEQILLQSGSAWGTSKRSGRNALALRMTEGAAEAIERTIAASGHPGARLAEAFQSAYGVQPDPSQAYSLAVKAVEDASIPIVLPLDSNATLGKVIASIRQSGRWKLPNTREHRDHPTSEVVIGMMQMLWTGQHDRHGGATPPPPPVTQAEAETAVTVAATLVELFVSQKIQKI
ncbi:hypothetical protein [Prescottella equi]|uniref:hypothetical protein n=1 Tax=Rhodococcus hoagii TaxID=43767 RepID=UPI000A11563A|nr:hypothetical protein [Prescottella equi]ORM18326.1 hypothetical protein A5N74_12025 [Prescottella equi]